MLCFHVYQTWFMASAQNFMKVFFPHVRRSSLIRSRFRARGGIPQSLQPDGGLHLSPGPLQFTKFIGIVGTMDWGPLRFSPVADTTYQLVVYISPRMTWHHHFFVLCPPLAATIPNYSTSAWSSQITVFRSPF